MEERNKDKGNRVCVDETINAKKDCLCVDEGHVVPMRPRRARALPCHHPLPMGIASAGLCLLLSSCASSRVLEVERSSEKTTKITDLRNTKILTISSASSLLEAVRLSSVVVEEYDTEKWDTIYNAAGDLLEVVHPVVRRTTASEEERQTAKTETATETATETTINTEVDQLTSEEEKVCHSAKKEGLSGAVRLVCALCALVLVLIGYKVVRRFL